MPHPDPSLDATGALLRALADPVRLELVRLLAPGERCVCHLVDALGLAQPNVSQHLGVLRRAGAVRAERRGSWVHYRLAEPADPGAAGVLRAVVQAVEASAAAQAAGGPSSTPRASLRECS